MISFSKCDNPRVCKMGMPHELSVLKKQLKFFFGFDNFIDCDQEQTTQQIVKGVNDVYINLRPGGGKSICFQLPALLNEHKLTVVFVPRNDLGKNQVDSLRRKNIPAEFLYGGIRKGLRNAIINDLRSDSMQLKFLYVSTDKKSRNLVNDLIIDLNGRNSISFIVFDEAHCVSRLSQDYVANYRETAKFIQLSCPNIRKIALTGTATKEVRYDIFNELGMKEPEKYYTSSQILFNHDVHFLDTTPEPFKHLKNLISEKLGLSAEISTQNPSKFGIIFCRKKAAAKGVARKLGAMEVPVVSYHGDLSWKERNSIHERWITGNIPVIATTRNFSACLHRENVRLIVHWSMPLSIQQLVQENGKGAQDHDKTFCRVYFSSEEEDNILTHIKSIPSVLSDDIDIASRKYRFFQEVIEYGLGTKCRNAAQLSYFGKNNLSCYDCDACCDLKGLRSRIDRYISHRLLMKKRLINNFALKRIGASIKANNVMEVQSYSPNSDPSPSVRQRSYMRLLKELTNNYKRAQPEIKKIVQVEDIPEITRELEYSLRKGVCSRQKYNHDIVQAVRVIRDCTKLKLACGYLKFYQPEEKSIYNLEPDVVELVDDEDVKMDIEFVDLISDSGSGSETE